MVQQFLELLPPEVGRITAALLVITASAGAVLWVLGARFNRFLATLLTVGLGGAVGMQLPRWFGWTIDGAGPAVGAAVVLGVSGFILHRMWAGLLMGTTLALWATFITWICVHGTQPMIWPAVTEQTTVGSYLTELWNSLPSTMQRMTPFWGAAGAVSGLACSILWTRLTPALAWSITGLTMLVGAGSASMLYTRPGWLAHIPSTWMQAVILVAGVLLGLLVQVQFAGEKPRKSSDKSSKRTPNQPEDEP